MLQFIRSFEAHAPRLPAHAKELQVHFPQIDEACNNGPGAALAWRIRLAKQPNTPVYCLP